MDIDVKNITEKVEKESELLKQVVGEIERVIIGQKNLYAHVAFLFVISSSRLSGATKVTWVP